MKYIILLLFSLKAHALSGVLKTSTINEDLSSYYNIKIEELFIDDGNAQILFSKGWQLYLGQTLKLKFSRGRVCNAIVKSLRVKRGVIDISSCPHIADIEKGQLLSVPPMRYTVDKSYRPNSLYQKEKEAIGNLPSQNESWYVYTGLGLSPIGYNNTINEAIDVFSSGSTTNLAFYTDPIGFYWPINKHRSMIGIVTSAIFDYYHNESSFQETDTTTVDQTANLIFLQGSLSASYFQFFGKNIGQGWFGRVEAGISTFWGNLEVTYRANDRNRQGIDQDYSYSAGANFLIGGGYAWPISLYTRVMANLNYQYKSARGVEDGVNYGNNILALTVGFLF